MNVLEYLEFHAYDPQEPALKAYTAQVETQESILTDLNLLLTLPTVGQVSSALDGSGPDSHLRDVAEPECDDDTVEVEEILGDLLQPLESLGF